MWLGIPLVRRGEARPEVHRKGPGGRTHRGGTSGHVREERRWWVDLAALFHQRRRVGEEVVGRRSRGVTEHRGPGVRLIDERDRGGLDTGDGVLGTPRKGEEIGRASCKERV